MTNQRKLSGVLFAALATAFAASTLAQSVVPATPSVPAAASSAQTPAPTTTQFVLTRSGVVWEGKVVDKGESYSIELPGGGALSASKLDVLFIGDTREAVFAYKVKEIRMEDVNEVLKLADWAGRRQMGGEAIKVLTARLETSIDDAERRALQKKIDELTTTETLRANAAKAAAAYEDRRRGQGTANAPKNEKKTEDEEIDAWGRSLPPAALERFGRKALPAIQKRCATSGCHDPETPGARYVARKKAFGPAQRLALLYTLRDTIAYVDFENLEASPILNHPPVTNAMGERVFPFGSDRSSTKDCAAFVEWLETLKEEPALAAAAQEYRLKRGDAPVLRSGAASRYDVVDVTKDAGSAPATPAAPTSDQSFADLFDGAPSAATPAGVQNAPADPAAPIFQQGLAKESSQFMPDPFDDVNSTESTLGRVGMIPRKSYRDEYDPAIFNDRYHASAPPPPSPEPTPADYATPTGPVDVTAPGGRAANN